MAVYSLLIISAVVLIFLVGVTFGHSLVILKLRKEENKKRELELAMLEKRPQLLNLKKRKEISDTIEEILFQVNVEKEINNILRNKDTK
ncbi:MAG: hypothetical protein JW795_13635 [Chitinivibrionales bacterium]|nr:hypothetical protein [Chitinivibrionales bacterium]